MTKEEMIKVIYEKIADKTLSFGCKVIPINIPYGKNDNFRIIHCRGDCYRIVYRRYFEGGHCEDFIDSNIKQIIGHPVMIGDVLDYIDSIEFNHPNDFIKWHKEKYPIIMDTLFTDWEEKRNPIEQQSLDCITYIYNLIK